VLARRRVSPRLVAAGVLAAGGAALVHGGGAASPIGLAWALGAMVGEVGFSVLAVSLVTRLGPLVVSAYSCVAAAVLLAAGAPFLHGTAALQLPTGQEVGAVVYLGVVVNGAATVGWYAGLRRLGVEHAGLFAALIPLATLPAAVLVGTGTIGLREAAGATLVGLAILLGLSRTPRTSERPPGRDPQAAAPPAPVPAPAPGRLAAAPRGAGTS
jgi:drug/metabolite transporter (DMT)-like permease